MEYRDYEELKTNLGKELKEIMSKKSMGMAEIEIIDKLTHSIKSIDKILECEEDMGSGRSYSMGSYRRGGSMGRDDMQYADMGTYRRGSSRDAGITYDGEGEHYYVDKFHPGEYYRK